MSRDNPWGLLAVLMGLFCVIALPAPLRGTAFVNQHEGDILHLLDMLFRMEQGQVPHLDFMTPIGALSLWPIALFLDDATGPGAAFLWAQALVAAALLPAVAWVAVSRLTLWTGAAFGAAVFLLTSAMVHGEAVPALSLSMHYNRWAWAIAFVALAIAILPSRRAGQGAGLLDGAILGLCFGALALIKVTYVAAFGPVVLAALAMRRDWTALGMALAAGLAVAAAVSLRYGFVYWAAYVGDILYVAGSEVRSAPGRPVDQLLVGPAYVGATLIAVGAAFLLRRGGEERSGLLLVLSIPGFVLVTWQNWGNDPQWLYLLPVLLLALRPTDGRQVFGRDMRGALTAMAAGAAAIALPSAANLAQSIAMTATDGGDSFAPMFAEHPDLQMKTSRATEARAVVTYDPVGWTPVAGIAGEDAVDAPQVVAEFMGAGLDDCMIQNGTVRVVSWIAEDLVRAGVRPEDVVVAADLAAPFWLFADMRPADHGAPWYYGGLPGFDGADWMVVPQCPILSRARDLVLAEVTARGLTVTEAHRSPAYILYALGAGGEAQVAGRAEPGSGG